MPEQIWAESVALSTAPIFDDAVYLSEALHLPANQSEDDLDAELAVSARASGIQDPYRFLCPVLDVSRALSTLTVDSDHGSSLSIHSHETQSTSFTSAPSRTSRDHTHPGEPSPAQRLLPKLAQATLSAENHNRTMEGPASRWRLSTSTLPVIHSVLSSSSSIQSHAPRRKRASGLFNMFKKDSSSCSSRSHQGHHDRSRGDKLECGHSLSPFAIRVHIQEALQSGAETVPNCCGKALPRVVLESVLTKEETDLVLNGALPPPDIGSLRDSGYCEGGVSLIDLPRIAEDTFVPTTSRVAANVPAPRTRHEAINIDAALANEAFKSFQAQQKDEFERITDFECNQRKALLAHHQCSLKRLAAQHEAKRVERMERHILDIEHLEELQIAAEHDLRKAQQQETLNVATALKHMEAYCLGTNVNHPEHAHTVSEDDFQKLDLQRIIRLTLPRKQENAINVLRARQERETKRKLQKQEQELDAINGDHETQQAVQETEYNKELEKLESLIAERRTRLLHRSDLKFEIWRRDWEEQHSTKLTTRLEHEQWPRSKTMTATPISGSSALAHFVKAAT